MLDQHVRVSPWADGIVLAPEVSPRADHHMRDYAVWSSAMISNGGRCPGRRWACTRDMRLARPHISGDAAFVCGHTLNRSSSGEDGPTAASGLDLTGQTEFVRFVCTSPLP